ncbi:GNAT family N-acetyltransferase [Rhizobacter sp. Root1221]|uniref:GNAT family N-acetyltransferase n=1 Tax=Rhizobacter sp. Root1221 TaxID=1736433 RepID=UPI0007017FB6|nr:GNAT family N-acetyltransferase [Rhizobacter sp. Root1221]KQW02922.1 hypothetical protein ASC87_00800 [Rhizobacter sp. Root1221]
MRSVAVAPGLHRQGIGEAMVGLLLHEARRSGIAHVFLLTTTATDYFPRFGFTRLPREQAPQALQASAEFNGACPAGAVFMGVPLIEIVAANGCCGGPATSGASACCALDEEKKAQGESGCGCASVASAEATPVPAAAPASCTTECGLPGARPKAKVGCCA